MMAAVAVGAYDNMNECIDEWVVPLLGEPERADDTLEDEYNSLFAAYIAARSGLKTSWSMMAEAKRRGRRL